MNDQTDAVSAQQPVERMYFNSKDLELLTGTSESTWRKWAVRGDGPPSCLIGRRRMWRKSAVLAWLEAQEAASA